MSWTDLPDGVDRRISSLVRDGLMAHRKRVKRTRIVTASIVGASLVLGGTAGTALVIAGQSERTRTAHCYSEADLGQPYTQVGLPAEAESSWVGADPTTVAAKRAGVVEDLCGAMWRAGMFADDSRSSDPDLAICEERDGVLAALPKFDGVSDTRLCEEVGLLALVR